MSKIDKMEFHEFCQFPIADQRTLHDLADDIARHGLVEPIVRYEGRILDGRCRFLACQMAEVAPRFEEYTGDKPYEFVMSKNLYRRHLTEPERSIQAHDELAKSMKKNVLHIEQQDFDS